MKGELTVVIINFLIGSYLLYSWIKDRESKTAHGALRLPMGIVSILFAIIALVWILTKI